MSRPVVIFLSAWAGIATIYFGAWIWTRGHRAASIVTLGVGLGLLFLWVWW